VSRTDGPTRAIAGAAVPILASDIIERPRLFSLLQRAASRPVTTVSGPVGWGKTTLVAHGGRLVAVGEPGGYVLLRRAARGGA
jgi:ATP/maltotriose-dependent transcriptional regulator MalT